MAFVHEWNVTSQEREMQWQQKRYKQVNFGIFGVILNRFVEVNIRRVVRVFDNTKVLEGCVADFNW